MEDRNLIDAARKWASEDLDEACSGELTRLADAKDTPSLRDALAKPLVFGTAGLRGNVGPGPARMNLATVARASWALADYISASEQGGGAVVVGFDARPDSERFARLSAEVLSGAGLRVLLGEAPLPTPCIAYAVRKEGAAAGIVVTASHNPRGDSGFKVFDGEGVQIVAPWDEEVARRMNSAPPAREIQRSSDLIDALSAQVLDSYFSDNQATAEELVPLEAAAGGPITLSYTALHGVGFASAKRALEGLGGAVSLSPVPEQAEPDGTFPTTAFPNPEESGALDKLLCQAKAEGARAACAHDPDADRFALCLPLGGPELVRLSGDALGLLFADACLRHTRLRNPEVISTIVSSPGAGLLAERYGARMTRTLTGFKWLCHAALESDAFLFAYEEALGYCFAAPEGHEAALDKDGILALLVAARLLVQKGGGEALAEHLLSIYKDIGLWGSFGHSRRFEGPGALGRLSTQLDRLRETPDRHLGGLLVTKRVDYRESSEQRPWYLGTQDLLRFDLEPEGEDPSGVTSGRVFVRPSGTEPKLKAYVHLCSDFSDESEYAEKSAAQARLARAIAGQVLKRPESIMPPAPGAR